MQPNLKDLVASRIRELVLSGRLRPGQKIDQDQLAKDFEISKLPVREALIVLEGDGLIDNIARRGAFVAQLTRDDVRDHYAIYGLLSGHGARRAAEILDQDGLAALEAMIDKMETTDSATESEHLNFSFHRTINRAGGSRRLLAALRMFSKTIPARFYEFTADWKPRAIDDHRRILAALRSRDADEAARLVSLHLQTSGEYAVRMLEEAGFWDEEAGVD